ncbi:trichohyalin-like isoform X2 [Phymastichus coffea]|uniref:trichohyalin-like isoform X2 n=1 Tax=Phymastichus coffea TaxID=108790 RepID=UPI00273C527E|nr:trichohyalin-like isoform X2 [Phymastichus coffea]
MSEPVNEEVLQPSMEVVNEEAAEQVVESKTTEEHQPQKEKVEIEQEKEESSSECQKVEQHPVSETSESQSQEEQQKQTQDEGEQEEQPEKTLDDSQDTVKMPITDSPERALEDEEMPSMVTISSTSRVDDSVSYNKQNDESKFVDVGGNSPKQTVRQEKDSDSDSVCVIDDDDDYEEQNDYDDNEEDDQNNHGRIRHNDEDEEESYEEFEGSSTEYSDESEGDEDHYNEKYNRRYQKNDRRDVEEDVEDEDDEEDGENDDDYNDDQDFGGGGSDDAILRPNNNGLSKQQKERSSSLQDLSLMEGSSLKNRHNVNPFSQKAIFERNQGKRKPYAHVQSKVKKYIDDLAEQRRISNERRKKSIDEARNRNYQPTEIQIQRSEEVVLACQTMKNYTEKTLKEVAESEENEKITFLQQGVENGEISLIPRQLVSCNSIEIANKAQEMEIDLIEDEDKKRPSFNGTAPKENQNNFMTERKGILRRESGPLKSSILNGEDPLSFQPIDNLRTLSYDEYMRGSVNETDEVVVNRIEITDVQSIPVQNVEIEDDSGLRIESVVSNYSTEKSIDDFQNRKTPIMVNQSTETFYRENSEIHNLRLQLNHRNQQFKNLREAYQKTMSDNLAMRMELENLRKTVAYYQEQQKTLQVETKVSAVQTEKSTNTHDMPLIEFEDNDPKLGVSTVSTQWSDSTGSVAAISMDPPNVTTALNSDESCQPSKTPIHKRNALSRAFMTSTKILQTLSSITYGKIKVDKSGKPSKVNEIAKPSKPPPGPSSSKKRKASDTMDGSTQPTKIPHLSKSTDQEENASITSEPPFVNPNTIGQESANANTKKNADEQQVEESTSDDDVKVYVYPEDEEGRQHSFLIQAKEVSDNPKPGVRECGPYLLGNVEVYMTEVNGTINIWGKELSQTSQTSQATVTTEDFDTTARSRELQQNLRWQSTPRIFNKNEGLSASTSKKSRLLPRYAQPSQESQCEHNQRLSCLSCHEHQHHHHQQYHQHQHSCCSPPIIRVEAPCGCIQEQKKIPDCCKAKSMPNINQNCCCNGYKPLARRHSFNPTDEEDSDEDDVNRTLISDNCTPHSLSKTKTVHQCSSEPRSSGGSPSDPSNSCENESDPLIGSRQVLDGFEGPEKRKKKVRGLLMDLLKKGCVGDCRTPNPLDKTNLHHTTSIYEPSTSAQHRASCLPSQPPHSHHSNERCSSCCKPDKTSQIEAQMERFREEMDKLRSQSDTLAGMIQALKSADIIN